MIMWVYLFALMVSCLWLLFMGYWFIVYTGDYIIDC